MADPARFELTTSAFGGQCPGFELCRTLLEQNRPILSSFSLFGFALCRGLPISATYLLPKRHGVGCGRGREGLVSKYSGTGPRFGGLGWGGVGLWRATAAGRGDRLRPPLPNQEGVHAGTRLVVTARHGHPIPLGRRPPAARAGRSRGGSRRRQEGKAGFMPSANSVMPTWRMPPLAACSPA